MRDIDATVITDIIKRAPNVFQTVISTNVTLAIRTRVHAPITQHVKTYAPVFNVTVTPVTTRQVENVNKIVTRTNVSPIRTQDLSVGRICNV